MNDVRLPLAFDSDCDTDCILAATSIAIVGGLALICFGTILRKHCLCRQEENPAPYNAIDDNEV